MNSHNNCNDGRFEERDVFMAKRFLAELRTKMGGGMQLILPQVFVNGQYLGVRLCLL